MKIMPLMPPRAVMQTSRLMQSPARGPMPRLALRPRRSDFVVQILEKTPDKVKSRSYDLVLNGMEIGSGSIRIHNQELQQRVFNIIGINNEDARKRFGFLLEAFQFGAPPHGGFAFGIDRLLAVIAGEPSIREMIAFPKTSAAFCLMTGAPSDVDDKQLKELGIEVKKKTPGLKG